MNETLNETITAVNETVAPLLLGYALPITNSPSVDIYLISLIGSLFTTMVTKYMTDQTKVKALRKDMKDLQKKMRDTMKKDPAKAQKLQQEIMKKNMENMKHSMNPKMMLITMGPMLLLFFFVRSYYGHFGEFFSFFGWWTWTWLGTYIFFSIINSIILKKVLDVA